MKKKSEFKRLSTISNFFEVAFAIIILIFVAIRAVEIVAEVFGVNLTIPQLAFDRILSMTLALVIGVEFAKMLYKHTPETVIDVLLFAIARQTVIYQERAMDILIGVVAIAGLFAAKRFLIDWMESRKIKSNESNPKT